jgi:TolA-binding protein
MKKNFLIALLSIFTATASAQELKDPTLFARFNESSGNFMVLTPFNKIGKSAFTIDDMKDLQRELKNLGKVIAEQQRQLDRQKQEIADLKKANNRR